MAVRKLSNERRNAIPYCLWTSQPWYGTRRRRTPRRAKPDIVALRKELRLQLTSWYTFEHAVPVTPLTPTCRQ